MRMGSVPAKISGVLLLLLVVGWRVWPSSPASSTSSETTTTEQHPSIPETTPTRIPSGASPSSARDGADRIARAFRDRASGEMIHATGKVKKVLPDDNDGDRHQKSIVTLTNSHTILIVHNIDLAPRVPWRSGDTIEFYGEYEWSEEGGVMHWTHHDPARRHEDGWIKHNAKVYK